jgi:xanthine dehydrogenase YagS FAD-binding subunit
MNAFTFERLPRPTDAASAVSARPGAMFLAGGTTLVDLMKVDVLTPDAVVDVRPLGLSSIDVSDGSITVGAAVTNSQLAWHPAVRDRFPVLLQAILSGATTQIRNMATVAGNILQRTRCSYFRDVHASCNRRQPGSGCDALDGFNRSHAVLGVSDHCLATHPSAMCVAMAVLDAEVHTVRADGTTRSIPFGEFHGGQFFPGTLVATAVFPFTHGLYRRGPLQVFVSQGAGTFMSRVRLGTSNELNILRLRPTR